MSKSVRMAIGIDAGMLISIGLYSFAMCISNKSKMDQHNGVFVSSLM